MSATNQNPERIEVGAADAPRAHPPKRTVDEQTGRISYEPADAPEPPWVVAANELAQFEPHHGQLSDGGQWFRRVVSIVQRACNAHTAALAQERDALKREKQTQWNAVKAVTDDIFDAIGDADHVNENINVGVRRVVTERNEARSTVARLTAELANATKLLENRLTLAEERCERLTAERDRMRAALDALYKTELHDNEAPFQIWNRMTTAARAALAPTQKEEAKP